MEYRASRQSGLLEEAGRFPFCRFMVNNSLIGCEKAQVKS